MSTRTGPPEKEAGRTPCQGRPSTNDTRDQHDADTADSSRHHGHRLGSAAVSWWSVHECVTPILDAVGTWPMAGTPEWVGLPDHDPRKVAALLDAAQHWALRVETCQQAQCEASRAVSGAADWAAIGREIRVRNDFYRSRPWLRRVIT
jgi:hypothetical protein